MQQTPNAQLRPNPEPGRDLSREPNPTPSPEPARSPASAALFAQALALHRAGRLDEAEHLYRQVLAVQPSHFDSLQLLGVISMQRGNYAKAVLEIAAALEQDPDNVPALNNRGNALNELHRFDEALASFDRALRLAPDLAETHCNRGNTLKELDRFEESLASYDRALALHPDYAAAHGNRANALNALGRHDEAAASCDRALALAPNFAEAHCNRGNALKELGRLDQAVASYDRAIALRPGYAQAYLNRGNALHELHRFDEALAGYDRALALRPDFAEAHSNRGNVLQELRRFAEALSSYDRAVLLRPDFAEAHSNRGNALKELDRFDEALASFARARSIRPQFADAHFNEALCRLLIGDLARGFEQYEWRWGTEQLRGERRNFAQPQWSGAENLAGKTVLIHAEQGFGDTLQFCRYLPRVAERAGKVIFEVQKPLLTLMRQFAGIAQIVPRGEPLGDFDLHCPLMSLPRAFATRLDSIPAQPRYLDVPADKAAAWRERLRTHQDLRVGIAWAGSPRPGLPHASRLDRQRSIAFDCLAPILKVAGCAFYSLQKGERAAAQLHASTLCHHVIDFTDELHDFADTAALVENLDLVIAVDTSIVHLAGALGKPLWLINRHNTCWRWLRDSEDSPWYPTVRIFRQDAARSFDPVIARIATALADHAADHVRAL
jgi:tetratricopeptide (TPR) repeat protein